MGGAVDNGEGSGRLPDVPFPAMRRIWASWKAAAAPLRSIGEGSTDRDGLEERVYSSVLTGGRVWGFRCVLSLELVLARGWTGDVAAAELLFAEFIAGEGLTTKSSLYDPEW
jgi:hypothetical protein